jgi:hypothetical protein
MVIQTINKQRGAVVISLSVIFLLLTTFVTLYVAKAILLEQKIMNNEMRSKLAFEAAEFGVSAALDYIGENPDRDANGIVDPIFTLVNNIGTTNVSAVDTQSVEVTITALGTEGLAYQIVSQGFSDDKSATRTVTQIIKVKDAFPNSPDNPLTARGAVDINGSGTVRNLEGHSTIWSGGDVDIGSNNAMKTEIANPSDGNYPDCMDTPMTCSGIETSDRDNVGLDIIEHDSSLSNLTATQMFENFFGMTPQKYKDSMANVQLTSGDAISGVGIENAIIWHEGDADLNGGTGGCTVAVNGGNICPQANEDPAITIIWGDATMKGGPHFYGVVFVMGDIYLSGNSTFHGALIVAGNSNNTITGSLDIWYNSRLLDGLSNNGGFGSASGAWKDF